MYSASIENRGDSRHYAVAAEYGFVIDTEGQGAHPVDVLLASLCGCIGHHVREYLRERRLECAEFDVRSEADSTKDGLGLSDIRVKIDLKGAALGDFHRAELLRRAHRCRIHSALKAGSRVEMVLIGVVATEQERAVELALRNALQ